MKISPDYYLMIFLCICAKKEENMTQNKTQIEQIIRKKVK